MNDDDGDGDFDGTSEDKSVAHLFSSSSVREPVSGAAVCREVATFCLQCWKRFLVQGVSSIAICHQYIKQTLICTDGEVVCGMDNCKCTTCKQHRCSDSTSRRIDIKPRDREEKSTQSLEKVQPESDE